MSDRDRKPPFRRGGGKGPDKRRESGRRPAWRDRGEPRRAGDPVWLAHGCGGAGQSPAQDPQTLADGKCRPAARRREHRHQGDAGNRPPGLIDQRLGPDAVHQGLLAEADPLPSPDIETLPQDGIVLVLDQITDPHNVGAIMRSAAAFAVKAIVTTARHSPEATGVLAKSASGALELVPLVTVQNLARALTEMNERGFLTVGLDSQGRRISARWNCGSRSRWCWAPRARACGS